MVEQLKGVVALSITPFTSDGKVDEEAFRENIRFLIDSGADVLVPNGSCGECYALTIEEQKKVIKIAVEEAGGKIPVYPGASHSGTNIAIELSKYAEDVGADGVQVIPPYYYMADVVSHYLKICEAIEIGMIVYNNPEVVAKALTPQVLLEMANKAENLVGVKDCTENLNMTNETIRLLGDKVAILCGTGESLAPFFYLLGSPGTYSSIVNFAPEFPVEMNRAAVKGDYKTVMEIHKRLTPLLNFISTHGPFIRVIKGAMEILGRQVGSPRAPLTPLTKQEKEELTKILENLELLEK